MKSIRVALGQVRPKLGDIRTNADKLLDFIHRAKLDHADVIVFPELSLTGYLLRDLVFDVARRLDDPVIATIVGASTDIDIVFSFVEETDDHLFYTSSVYASKGRVIHVHRKVYLPTYGLFEEGRHFAKGNNIESFACGSHRAGIAICEDAWHPSVPYLLSVAGMDILYIPSAGPGRALSGDPHSGSQQFWERLIRTYAQLYTCYVVFVNRVGFEDGLFFFGHSAVAGPDGELLCVMDSHDEDMHIVTLDLSRIRTERYRSPLLRDEDVYLTHRILGRLVEERQ
ncbi:MAG: acyltransferase [Acidibacillus sp.]|uniref:Glutamine-dependent NAD(+) synthetase n=1 Tax=Sulfoacidibacillus ferrooxidans TaxID=2005001 RepID=A0A9X1V5S6_9BACL|nr:Glutamine-dependent NAD(+) synthetase [Sulfoacidibacillus ferrooxidans]MCY0892407.1 acyltransferase [Acidibacillus sp.]